MADVKWIKIHTGIFDDEKIKLIDSMPDRDAIFVIWIKLLTLAGKVNNNGFIYVSEEMPYTEEMYSAIFNRPLNTVKMALEVFKRFNMIEIFEGKTHITNWEKHQNIEALERIREANRKRVAKHRENVKLLTGNVTCNVTVTECNAIEEDKNKNKIKNKIKNKKEEKEEVTEPEFMIFWEKYGKKVDREKCIKKWKSLSEKEKDLAINKVEEYVKSQPDKQYRKNPLTWLNGKCWNDEIIEGGKTYGKGKNNSGDNSGNTKQGGSKYDDLGIFG